MRRYGFPPRRLPGFRKKEIQKMKYSMNTFRLYQSEKNFSRAVSVRVTMKEEVDLDTLRRAVNEAMKRYPYFAVEVSQDAEGGYILLPNPREILVRRAEKKLPLLGSQEVNMHLCFAECEGRDIYFHITHALCGGRGFLPWVQTCIYQYVSDRYEVTPNAPGIRNVGSPLLPGEDAEPSLESLPQEAPIYQFKGKGATILAMDYLNGLMNPFKRKPNYRRYTFYQKDIMSFVRETDASVASFFLVVMAKALDRVLPKKNLVIGGEIAHNPSATLGIPNTHVDILSHIRIDYTREQLKWDMERLGTMTRGQMILQTDPSVSLVEVRSQYQLLKDIEGIHGIKKKKAHMKKGSSEGKNANHGTYIVNYSGRMDWGEVADYVESYVILTEGHLLLEVTSMEGKIFVSFMQLLDTDKYASAFEAVLADLQIPFRAEGPFPRNLTKHQLPDSI